jgi:predicted PurR-regulated permease PerM
MSETVMKGASSRAALLVVAVAVGVMLIGLYPLAAGLVAAPALAVLCRPLQERLATRMHPSAAALLIVVGVWIVCVVPGAWLMTLAVRQAPAAINAVRHVEEQWRATQQPILGVNPDTLVARLGSTSMSWFSAALGPTLGGVGHGIMNLSIAVLGLYFLLGAGETPWQTVRRHLPFSAEGSDRLRRTFVDATRATLYGTLLSATLQGLSIGVGLRAIGNDAPAFWGTIGGFATLVPVVGNALVWVPAVVVPVAQGRLGAALTMLVFGKAIPAVLDRVVKTAIGHRIGNTHPMVTLLGALVGVRLIGAVGVLVGPALVQCTLALIQLYDREYATPGANPQSD